LQEKIFAEKYMSQQQVPLNIRRRINVLMSDKNYADALSLLQELCKSVPHDVETRYLMGCCLGSIGKQSEAIHILQQCIGMQPNVAQFHHTLGKLQLIIKQYDIATESFRNALVLDETLTDVYVDLAITRLMLQDFDQSRQYYKKALRLDPALAAAYYGLGCISHETGQYERAIEYLEQALAYQANPVDTLCKLGSAHFCQSRIDESAACYEKALLADPASAEAAAGIATIYEFKGETETAIELIEPLIHGRNYNPALATVFAKLCKHMHRCEEAIDYIDGALQSPDLSSTRTRKHLHFEAAHVLDMLQQYDAAFTHFKAGNDAEAQHYNTADAAKQIDNMISTYSAALYKRLPRSSRKDSRPVFIIGMPRSGTSLTEQILAAHTGVHAAGELFTLSRIVECMPKKPGGAHGLPGRVAYLDQQDLDTMSECYLAHLNTLTSNALRITDKMPENFYHLGIIQLLFPGSRIIHCTRNALDNGLSIYFQNFTDEIFYAKSLFNIGVQYHQYQRLMAHWKQVLTLPMLEINYEHLVSDQETVTRQMLDFCELEWDAKCLRFHKSGRNVLTASYDQVRQPLYKKSVGRWINYEQYIGDLRDGLQYGQ